MTSTTLAVESCVSWDDIYKFVAFEREKSEGLENIEVGLIEDKVIKHSQDKAERVSF